MRVITLIFSLFQDGDFNGFGRALHLRRWHLPPNEKSASACQRVAHFQHELGADGNNEEYQTYVEKGAAFGDKARQAEKQLIVDETDLYSANYLVG